MTSPEIVVSSDVLKWARESSGYSIGDVAKKADLPQSTLEEWERKRSKIRYSVLNKLAGIFKRPTVALLLNAPPSEPSLPKYFRRTGETGKPAPEVLFAIRKARHLQHISKSLEENMDTDERPSLEAVTLDTLPERVAERERSSLGIDIGMQMQWKTPIEALKAFRASVEKKNIFVFQIAIPKNKAQGLSLPDATAPVIVLNSKDMHERRIFTLFHEYAHLLLGKSGVCAEIGDATEDAIENWCDRFAGAFLVPKNALSAEISRKKIQHIAYPEVQTLAKSFNVSKRMLFVRLKVNGFIPVSESAALSKIFDRPYAEEKQPPKLKGAKKKGGGVPQDRKCVSEKGRRFISLVLANSERQKITTADALEYLSVKLPTLQKIESALGR